MCNGGQGGRLALMPALHGFEENGFEFNDLR
jgi:hypothetical protein